MGEEQRLLEQIEYLKKEHRSLDAVIAGLGGAGGAVFDQIRLQKLKKEKLTVKDKIAKLEAMLYPDIIA